MTLKIGNYGGNPTGPPYVVIFSHDGEPDVLAIYREDKIEYEVTSKEFGNVQTFRKWDGSRMVAGEAKK